MPRKKASPEDTLTIVILRDGVFIADDDRRDEGDQCTIARDVAEKIIANGHGKRV